MTPLTLAVNPKYWKWATLGLSSALVPAVLLLPPWSPVSITSEDRDQPQTEALTQGPSNPPRTPEPSPTPLNERVEKEPSPTADTGARRTRRYGDPAACVHLGDKSPWRYSSSFRGTAVHARPGPTADTGTRRYGDPAAAAHLNGRPT